VKVTAIATPLPTSGRFIVSADGKRVRLAGVNWYGGSEDIGVPAGLDCTNRTALAELIAAQGFNCVRLPFSLWMTRQTAPVPDQYLLQNPDLHGSTPLQVYDACVKALTDQGLIVIPNCHLLDFGWCCSNDDTNGLWFNDRWEIAQFTATWQDIATRYASNPLVAAIDIKNEPRHATVGGQSLGPAWGTAVETDFAVMYTAVGNLIHGGGGSWWANIQAWLKEADVDWCWWALNSTHGQSSTPGTNQIQNYWGAPEPYGLLTLDWQDVGYPALMTMLQAMMQPRTGPGIG
jgi:Cellulase (glycosyl hydrolase family 5)